MISVLFVQRPLSLSLSAPVFSPSAYSRTMFSVSPDVVFPQQVFPPRLLLSLYLPLHLLMFCADFSPLFSVHGTIGRNGRRARVDAGFFYAKQSRVKTF